MSPKAIGEYEPKAGGNLSKDSPRSPIPGYKISVPLMRSRANLHLHSTLN